MKLKRLYAALLAITMVATLPACTSKPSSESSSSGADSSPQESSSSSGAVTNGDYGGLVKMADADKPITYKIFIRDPGTAPSKSNPVLKKITELTGVSFDFEFLVGDLEQKVGVMIAGEDYPDVIYGESTKFINANAFIPLEESLPKYYNLNNHYERYYDLMKAADGHMYTLEVYNAFENAAPIFTNTGSGFYIQKAVLEEASYAIPHTVDDYFKLIEDYQAKHPEIDGVKTIGFEILCDGWRDFCLRNPALHLLGSGNEGDVIVDQNTFKASYYQITDTAKNYYKKLNEEYRKGVIEAETLTQNYDQYISRISTGAVLGFFDQQWNFSSGENVLKADGKFERTYVSVPIANAGVKDSYIDARDVNNITGTNGIGITNNCKEPERLLAYYDWLLQREVQDYLQWGEEGTGYIQLENGGKKLTDESRQIARDTAKKRDQTGDTLWQFAPKRQGLYDDGSPCGPGDSEDEFLASQSEYDQKFIQAYGFKYPAEMLSEPVLREKYYPVWGFNIEDGSPAAVAKSKVEDICRMYYPRLIICEPSEYDALWDEFLKAFEAGNTNAFVDEVNRQITEKMK